MNFDRKVATSPFSLEKINLKNFKVSVRNQCPRRCFTVAYFLNYPFVIWSKSEKRRCGDMKW